MCNIVLDMISLMISVIAIIVSLFTWHISNKRETAEVEIEIKRMIDDRKDKIESILQDKKKINYLIEEELNAYDKACALYLDKKVDRNRFKKDYIVEINNLFNSDEIIKIGRLNEERCVYVNLKKVYNIWKDEN